MKKFAKLIVLLLTVLTIVTVGAVPAHAYTDNGQASFIYWFDLGVNESGNISVVAHTKINNPGKVEKHLKTYSSDGNYYYMVTGGTNEGDGYRRVNSSSDYKRFSGGSLFYNAGYTDDVEQYYEISASTFKTYAKSVETFGSTKPVKTSYSNSSVTFDWSSARLGNNKGSSLTHEAYMFAAWMHESNVLTDLARYNRGPDGKLGPYSPYWRLTDCVHLEYQYKFAGSSDYTDSKGTVSGHTSFPFSGSPGDSIRVRLVSQLGYTSDWVYHTFPGAYKVHYNSNFGAAGGTGTMADQTFYVGESKNLSANSFSHNSYTVRFDGNGSTDYPATIGQSSVNAPVSFKHWTKTATDSTAYYTNQQSVKDLSTTNGATVNLYAQWSPGSITLPTATRPGYVLKGWFTAKSGGTRVGTSGDTVSNVNSNRTYYAQWEPVNLIVRFKDNENGNYITYTPNNGCTNIFTVEDEGKLPSPGDLDISADKGYRFTSGGKGSWLANSYNLNRTQIYNAKIDTTTQFDAPTLWKKIYYDKPTSSLTLSAGWRYTSSGALTSEFKSYKSDRYVDLYPDFSRNVLTVVYNANGGTGTKNNEKYYYDSTVAFAPMSTFTKTGYYIAGWATSPTGPKVYDCGGTIKSEVLNSKVEKEDCTTTLYAVWEPIVYKIRYSAAPGEFSSGNNLTGTQFSLNSDKRYINDTMTYYYGQASLINILNHENANPKRLGYHVSNPVWKSNATGNSLASGGTASFASIFGATPDSSAKEITVTVNLQWTPNEYKIEYYADLGEDSKYTDYIENNGYTGLTTVTPSWNDTNMPFKGKEFKKASDIQNLKYDDSSKLFKNKFNFVTEQFQGWYAYNETTGEYAIKNGNTYKWAASCKYNQLYKFTDEQAIKNLTPNDGDVIRMFACQNYPGGPSDGDKSLIPNKYYIYYCGHLATSHDYPDSETVVTEACRESNKINQYVYQDTAIYNFDLTNDTTKKIKENKFAKTGYHIEDNQQVWIASRKTGDRVQYLKSFEVQGSPEWSELKSEALYIADKAAVANLTYADNEIIYMHAVWTPNKYKVVYCGNVLASNIDGYSTHSDINYSDPLNEYTENIKNEKCTNHDSKDYLHPAELTYDVPFTAYDCCYDVNKTGYRFYGWSTDPNHDFSIPSSATNYSAPNEHDLFDSESNTKTKDFKMKNLTTVNNDVVYLYAVWGPIQYQVKYSGNGDDACQLNSDSSTEPKVYNKSDKLVNYCFYDTEYVLNKNAFKSNSTFYAWKENFGEGKIYKAYDDNTKYDNGEKVKNLTSIDHGIVEFKALWEAVTTIRYNLNIGNGTLVDGEKYKFGDSSFTLNAQGLICKNGKPYEDILRTHNDDIGNEDTQLYDKVPLPTNDDLKILNNQGYTFHGWLKDKNDGNDKIINNETALQNIRNTNPPITSTCGNANCDKCNQEIILYQYHTNNKYTVYYCGNNADANCYNPVATGEPHNGSNCEHAAANSNICPYCNHYDDTTWTYGTGRSLVGNQFHCTAFVFAGWARTPDGEVVYTDEQVVNIPTSDGKKVYLYAKWTPTYIYYNLNLPGDCSFKKATDALSKVDLILHSCSKDNENSSYNIAINSTKLNLQIIKSKPNPEPNPELTTFKPLTLEKATNNAVFSEIQEKGYKFVGWSNRPIEYDSDSGLKIPENAKILYTDEEYLVFSTDPEVAITLEGLFGDEFSTENCLYAVWSKSEIKFQYKFKDYNENIYKFYNSNSPFEVNNNGFLVIKNEGLFEDKLINPDKHTQYNVRGLNSFQSYITSGFFHWELYDETLTHYYTKDHRWVSTSDKAYAFAEKQIIKYGEELDLEKIIGKDALNDENKTFVFVGVHEGNTDPLYIQYCINTPENSTSEINPDYVERYAKNDDNFITHLDGNTYIQTLTWYDNPDEISEENTEVINILSSDIAQYNGRHIISWSLSANGTGTCFTPEQIITNKSEAFKDLRNSGTIETVSINGITCRVVTLYAVWNENAVYIQFNTNGGIFNGGDYTQENGIVYKDGSPYRIEGQIPNIYAEGQKYAKISSEVSSDQINTALFSNCTKHPYEFSGKLKHGDYTIKLVDIKNLDIPLTQDELDTYKYDDLIITLSAVWEYNITLAYHSNGGLPYLGENGTAIEYTATEGEIPKIQICNYSNIVTGQTLKRKGFTAGDWNTQADGSGLTFICDSYLYPLSVYKSGDTINLYAQWLPSNYSIIYCGNGATSHAYTDNDELHAKFIPSENCNTTDCIGHYNEENIERNNGHTLVGNSFYKLGYSFVGWNTESNGSGSSYSDMAIVDFSDKDSPIYLYAQWEPIQYDVIYVGGSEDVNGETYQQEGINYGQVFNLNENGFIRDYYHFDPNACWIATRENEGNTETITGFDAEKNTIWSTDLTSPYIFKNSERVKNLSNIDGDTIVMTAQWVPNKLIIKYNTNKGELIDSKGFNKSASELILKDGNPYRTEYVYNPDNTSIIIQNDNYFGLYHPIIESDTELTTYSFTGWSVRNDNHANYPVDNLDNVDVCGIADGEENKLADNELVEITLYAVWSTDIIDDPSKGIQLQYLEGERVTYDRLLADINKISPVRCEELFSSEEPEDSFILYEKTSLQKFDNLMSLNGEPYDIKLNGDKAISQFLRADSNPDNDDNWLLYTYFGKLTQGEKVKASMSVADTNGKVRLVTITIIYNHPPVIKATDRWFNLDDALNGKITEKELIRTADSTDTEDGDISNLIKIKDFDASMFKHVGTYEITYTVTDISPEDGQNKTSETTALIHVIENYSNTNARFINTKFYLYSTLNADKEDDVTASVLYAKKLNGVLYFTDENGAFINDEDGNPYAVDAGFKTSSKIFINKNGIYTIVPLSKWYRDKDCVIALRDCLSNEKEEDGTWNKIEESWFFTAQDVKTIKGNIKENIIDPNFYSNQYSNGHCFSYTNKAKIANESIKAFKEMFSNEDSRLSAFTVSGEIITGSKYSITDDTVAAVAAEDVSTVLYIPQVTEQKTVIAKNALKDVNFKTVYIPDNTEIESGAFANCKNLKFVYIGDNCSFESDAFPENTIILKVNYTPYKES